MHPHEWSVRPRTIRYLLAVVGAFAWLSASVVARQGLQIDSRSPFLWGTAGAGVLAGLVAWVLCLRLSDAAIANAQNSLRTKLTHHQPLRTETASPLARWGLLASGILFFTVNTVWVYRHQDPPDDDDQRAFLITAQEIHDRGGIPQLWSDLWSGQFEESNRHPLLLAMQSLNPTLDGGRMVSIAAASVTFALILLLAWRKLGPLTAGILSVLIGINGAWLYHTPRIVCESLLTGLAGLLWLALIPPKDTTDPTTSRSINWCNAAVAGGLCGLVYLTKGTGLLLFGGAALAFVGMALTHAAQRRSWFMALIVFTASFVVISSPLLVRNQIRFGSATYNVNSYLLWVDAYESPSAMADRMTLREARTAYVASHSPVDMLKREATGLVWEAFIGLRTLGTAPWNDSRLLVGVPLFLIALVGMTQLPRASRLVLVLWTVIIWGAMAWYVPIAAGDRFAMPLLIPWLTLAADGLARLPQMTTHPSSNQHRIVLTVLILGVISTALVWTRTGLWEC
ncbi:MAG: hypothetical protein DWH81_03245 [Planctomycetota bacterium]|nr:MAG: hypothetical protein DWH81_03245 [Planctomycetota bacterium]